jgi:hypothetical protein
VLWCWEVGMDIWAGGCLPVAVTRHYGDAMMYHHQPKLKLAVSRLTIPWEERQLYVTGRRRRIVVLGISCYDPYTIEGISINYNVVTHRL